MAPTISDTLNFSIIADTCGTTNVAATSGICTVTLRANPTTVGSKVATLSRNCAYGGTTTTTTNQIVANGVTASLAWSPLTHNFGSVDVGSTTATQIFTLTNSGDASATGCTPPTLADPIHFSITTDNCAGNDLAGGNATCTVVIRGNPTSAGVKTTTLSRSCVYGGNPSTTTNQIIVNGLTASLAWTPLTHDFGDVDVGANSTAQTFTLQNSGTATATGCSAPTLADSVNFSITTDNCATNDLAGSGATCTVVVRGNPTTLGAKTTTLSRTCAFGGTSGTTSNQIVMVGRQVALAFAPTTHNFGNVNVGAQSATHVFTLENFGNKIATGCSAPTLSNAVDFEITADTCGTGNVAAAGTCAITVRANPQSTGAKSTTLSRTCAVGGTPTTTTNGLTTNAILPSLAWSPLAHDFGNVNTGSTSTTQTFTLTNSGSATATGCSAPLLSGSDPTQFSIITDNCGTNPLADGSATCTVVLQANPSSVGSKSATLSRTCTFGGTPSTTANQILVTGRAPALAWTPLSHAYGNVQVGGTSAFTFTLDNTGPVAATGCTAPTLSDAANFSLASDTCNGADLAAGANCTISVRANPTTPGAKATTLSRTCSFGGTAATTTDQITVTGTYPALAWSPLSKAFGNVNVGSSSAGQVFGLTNSGDAPATGCAAPTLDDTVNFSLSADGCGVANLATSATCNITVTAHPTSAGAKVANLSRTCTFGGTAATTTNQITAFGTAPSLAWTPVTHDFGSVNVGSTSATHTFTLTNSGDATATGCSAPTITDTANFTIETDNCGINPLAGAGSTCTVLVRGNPGSTGSHATTLSRTCVFGGSAATTTNQILVNGILPQLDWSPLSNNFGPTPIDRSNDSTQTFTLTNSGTATATGCSAPALGGTNPGQFEITTDNCGTSTLNGAGATCTVIVTGKPTTVGIKNATLSRTCTFGGTAATTADQLIVTGTAPVLAWTPLMHAFGNVNVGTDSATMTFTLENTGAAAATGCGAAAMGDTTNFSIVTNNCAAATLASGTTCTVIAKANPATAGAKASQLTRSCTFGGNPETTPNQITAVGTYPALSWSGLAHNFGNNQFAYGKSGSITFTLANAGTAEATGCSAPALTGSDPTAFEISIDNCGTANLATGTTCTVNVRTNLTATGLKRATLSRACTFGGTSTTTADGIEATGVSAAGVLAMTSENDNKLGSATLNRYTAVKEIYVSNTGTAELTGCGNPSLSDSTNFSIVSEDCGATIASGAHCTVGIRAKSAAANSYSSDLTMSCTGATASFTTNFESSNAATPVQMKVGNPSVILMSDGRIRYSRYGESYPVVNGMFTDATQVAAGYMYHCGLRAGGTIECYGMNSYGELGDGTFTDTWGTPVVVSGISDAIGVAANPDGSHTCAVLSTGVVKCWGEGTSGQLGDGGTSNSSTPVTVTGISTAISVSVGIYHSCAVLSDGTAKCWGNNGHGELGDGTNTDRLTPVSVQTGLGIDLTGITSLTAGNYDNTCAVVAGVAYCWGNGGYGKNGNGSTADQFYAVPVTGITNAVQMSLGYLHACARLADGTAKCWGENGHGELGDGTTTSTTTPVVVAGLTGVASIESTWLTTCAIKSDFDIKCWGEEDNGSTGNGSTGNRMIPTAKTGITNGTQMASGSETTCVRIDDGTVKCWGNWAENGQTLSGSNVNVTTPNSVPGITTAIQVAAARLSHCALLSNGTIQCWGRNDFGQLGDGTNDWWGPSVQVLGITNAIQITGGLDYFCARLADGTAKYWGRNNTYQLGDGTQNDASTPVAVAGLSGIAEIYASKNRHTCARLTSGQVTCWGLNDRGQLGDGTTIDRATPTMVPGLFNVGTMTLGESHSCALLTDGTVRCWGGNSNYQLGNGTVVDSSSPGNLNWFSNIAEITAGTMHTCARLMDGKVRCWGEGLNGKLGHGNYSSASSPSGSAALSLTGVTALSSGLRFNCALSGGSPTCWGSLNLGIPNTGLRSVSGFIP